MNHMFRLGVVVLAQALLVAGAMTVGAQTPAYQVVYQAEVAGASDLFLLDIDRQLVRNLTRHPGQDTRPVWSPDGLYIAFESWRSGLRAVFIMDADGRNLRRVSADVGASEYDPQWSADGRMLQFRSYRRFMTNDPAVAFFHVNPDGSGLELVDATSWSEPAPIERYISMRFVGGVWGIFMTNGADSRPLTDPEVTRELIDREITFVESPRWSPDDRLLAFLSKKQDAQSEIYLMDADGTHLRQITTDGLPKSGLRWRP